MTATIRAAQDGGDTLFVSAVAFAEPVSAALLAMDAGDALAVVGSLTVAVWTPTHGEPRVQAKVVAQALVSPYAVRHRRAILQGNAALAPERRQTNGSHERAAL